MRQPAGKMSTQTNQNGSRFCFSRFTIHDSRFSGSGSLAVDRTEIVAARAEM
jgi:hypothetical protein